MEQAQGWSNDRVEQEQGWSKDKHTGREGSRELGKTVGAIARSEMYCKVQARAQHAFGRPLLIALTQCKE